MAELSFVITPLAQGGPVWVPRPRSVLNDTLADFGGALQKLFYSTNGDRTARPISQPPMIGSISGICPLLDGIQYAQWFSRSPYGPSVGTPPTLNVQSFYPGQVKQGA